MIVVLVNLVHLRKNTQIWLFSLIFCGLYLAGTTLQSNPSSLPALNGTQKSRLRAGEVLTHLQRQNDTAGKITVIGLIPASRQEVFNSLTTFSSLRQIYPKILEGEIRRRAGNVEDTYMLLDYPFPLSNRWILTQSIKYPSTYSYRWERLDGDIKENKGYWKLYEFEGQTLIYYQVKLDPGLDLVPDRLIRVGMQVEAPEIVLNIRRYFKK